jgi:hypothetical protein
MGSYIALCARPVESSRKQATRILCLFITANLGHRCRTPYTETKNQISTFYLDQIPRDYCDALQRCLLPLRTVQHLTLRYPVFLAPDEPAPRTSLGPPNTSSFRKRHRVVSRTLSGFRCSRPKPQGGACSSLRNQVIYGIIASSLCGLFIVRSANPVLKQIPHRELVPCQATLTPAICDPSWSIVHLRRPLISLARLELQTAITSELTICFSLSLKRNALNTSLIAV